MSSIDEYSASVRAAAESVDSASSVIGAAKTIGDELSSQFSGMGADGKAGETNATTQRLEAEAAVMATQLKSLLEEIQQQIETLRGLGDAPGVGAGSSVDSSRQSVPGGSPTAPPLAKQLTDRLQVWDEDEPTIAYAYSDEDGVETEFRSGKDASAKTGLKPDYANRWVMDHAEAKAAAAIREATGDQHVTMVINKKPCQGVKGCDATLPDIIPAGSSITVYLRGSDSASLYRHYQGNGRGIEHGS